MSADCILLRSGFSITCDSLVEARTLHRAFESTASLDGSKVTFRRSMRICQLPKPELKARSVFFNPSK